MGVAYEAIDVGEDHDARDYLINLGATTTPVVVTSGGWWEGYRPDQLAML